MLECLGCKLAAASSTEVSNFLSPNVAKFLDSNRTYSNTQPKAYLNWIFLDEQFNYVKANSGVVQVLAGSSKMALIAPPQKISRNGYLYVYVSNESAQDVYFDDLTIKHFTGPLVQEQAFYPFGLQMAAISSKAILKTTDPYKYNAGSELEEELNYTILFTESMMHKLGGLRG